MPQYARCDVRFSFFLNEEEDFKTIADELAKRLLKHPKVDKVTFHANVGFEYVGHYGEEDG